MLLAAVTRDKKLKNSFHSFKMRFKLIMSLQMRTCPPRLKLDQVAKIKMNNK